VISIRRILCPVDFSPYSRRALAHAEVLARWYEAELTVMHAFGPLLPGLFGLEAPLSEETLASFDHAAVERELKAFAGAPQDAKHLPQFVVRAGAPAATIVHYAAEAGTDLVVLGTHGHTGFERFMLGSVTEKVVRKAPCPVLTVPKRAGEQPESPLFSRIVCGVDFSEVSDRAVRHALSLAQEARGHVTLLHVLDWLPDAHFAKYPQFDLDHFRRSQLSEARLRLDRLVPEEARNWCQPETRVACGKPYQQILATAQKEEADLIVLGVHGHGALDRMLFGSSTEHVVRQATCPVLTIRP
jgi:nucleotide-binding universal stress UspA family protein